GVSVVRDVGRAGDGRVLMIFNGHGKTASSGVAAGISDSERVDRGALGEGRAAGQTGGLHRGLAGAIVTAHGGGEGHDRGALTGVSVVRDVGRAGDGRVLMIFNGHGKTASSGVTAGVGGRAGHSRGAFGEGSARGWSATHTHPGTVVRGAGRAVGHNGAAQARIGVPR